jgi:Uma2 family endonuclease
LHGVVVAMTPSKPPHAFSIQKLNLFLVTALGDRAGVRIQLPLALTDDSEPEPDIAVVPPGDYGEAHPGAALLVIEVADSSLRKDRHIKAPLYASAGVPEYWLVNLVDGVVEVHEEPAEGTYRRVTRHARGETLRLESFPDVELRVADILR